MSLNKIYSGKVRDIYDAGDDQLLMVASDRLSAFDVILPQPIPDKGRVLNALTVFWLDQLAGIAPNHLVTADPAEFPSGSDEIPGVAGRGMLVRKAEMLPIECIVRGYISGSAWKEYQASGTMHGQALPTGLQQSEKLPEPVFTPSTKAAEGAHDEDISFEEACKLVGEEVAEEARRISLDLYEAGSKWAAERGIIIADTKFELGWIDGQLCVCDEVLTPDSSRFWPADQYEVGKTPPSFDKQPVRDWLEESGWNKQPPAPDLPNEVVASTNARYVAAYERVTGKRIQDWYGAAQ